MGVLVVVIEDSKEVPKVLEDLPAIYRVERDCTVRTRDGSKDDISNSS